MNRSPYRLLMLWSVLATALAWGLLEWTALTRSRVQDRLRQSGRRLA